MIEARNIVGISPSDARVVKTRNTLYRLGRIDPEMKRLLKKRDRNWNWRKPLSFKREG